MRESLLWVDWGGYSEQLKLRVTLVEFDSGGVNQKSITTESSIIMGAGEIHNRKWGDAGC